MKMQEKISEKRKKQLGRGARKIYHSNNYTNVKVLRTKKTLLKLNITGNVLLDLE